MTGVSKLSFSLLGAAGAIGGGIGVYKMYSKEEVKDQKKEKISEKLKNSLLKTTGTDDGSIWEVRVTTLNSALQTAVVNDLWDLKGKSNAKDLLKDWCTSKGNDEYVEGSVVLDNVKKYCTYNIKDKLKNAIDETSGDWQSISNSLKGKEDGESLSDAMKAVKIALNGKQPDGSAADADALKNWCSKTYEKMYEDNQDFKDASSYCVKDGPAG